MVNNGVLKRTNNTAAFLKWALEQESLRRAKTKLASEADVSISLVEKLINGTYQGTPSDDRRQRICRVTNMSEDYLFPTVNAAEEAS